MKAYLFKHNLPVKKFAADLEISVSYLYQLIRKERRPSMELALKIEGYTQGEVSAAELLNDRGDQSFSLDGFFSSTRSKLEKSIKSLESRLKNLEERFELLERLMKGG